MSYARKNDVLEDSSVVKVLDPHLTKAAWIEPAKGSRPTLNIQVGDRPTIKAKANGKGGGGEPVTWNFAEWGTLNYEWTIRKKDGPVLYTRKWDGQGDHPEFADYVFNEPGEYLVSLVLESYATGELATPVPPEVVVVAGLPVPNVQLDIYNGQSGANPVANKFTVGAFTVANLNDSDGDGRIDNKDKKVKTISAKLTAPAAAGSRFIIVDKAAEFEAGDKIVVMNQAGSIYEVHEIKTVNRKTRITLVSKGGLTRAYAANDIVTHRGRPGNEVDLMKLVIHRPNPDLGGNVRLTVKQGNIALWEKSTKETQVKLKKNAVEFSMKTLPATKTLWVEALDTSRTVRDIVLELEYQGTTDTVRATGVWAELLSFRNKLGAGLSGDANGAAIKAQFARNGGALGIQMVRRAGKLFFYNNVEVGFTVQPTGIGGEPGIAFDISRRRKTQGVNFVNRRRTVLPKDPYPLGDELPNDDPGPGNDEDVVPMNSHIFSIDGPGPEVKLPVPLRTRVRIFRERHFKEFVRIRFDGTRPGGNKVDGSRCSDKVPWFANDDVEKKSGARAFKITSSKSGKGNPPFSPLPK